MPNTLSSIILLALGGTLFVVVCLIPFWVHGIKLKRDREAWVKQSQKRWERILKENHWDV